MDTAAKAISLIRPGAHLSDRVRNKLAVWIDRASLPSALKEVYDDGDVRRAISNLGLEAAALEDGGLTAVEEHLLGRRNELPPSAPFGSFHDGTETLGRLCYAACRALQPAVVVETGVAYGVTSAYVLQALAQNERGSLHSIDLPPLGTKADQYVGYFVPQELRKRWSLRIGSARKLLPKVLQAAGAADIFIHDSLHTYAHMRMEFAAALDTLRPGGVLIADDVEGNRAFEEAVLDPRVACYSAIREKGKDAICGAIRIRAL
jgi:predicted O-methyltransferase YrrM